MDKLQVITSYSYSGIYFAGTYRAGIYPARIFLGVAGGAGGRTDGRAVAYADDMYVGCTYILSAYCFCCLFLSFCMLRCTAWLIFWKQNFVTLIYMYVHFIICACMFARARHTRILQLETLKKIKFLSSSLSLFLKNVNPFKQCAIKVYLY